MKTSKRNNSILSLTLLLNPLLMLFTSEGGVVNYLHLFRNRDSLAEVPFDFQMEYRILEVDQTDEEYFKPKPYHYTKRAAMYNLFEEPGATPYQRETYPIGKITFLLSTYIACSSELRSKFYDRYKGHVPVITKFLLTFLRIGSLPDGNQLTGYEYSEEYYTTQSFVWWPLMMTGSGEEDGGDIEKIVSWFIHLYEVDINKGNDREDFYFYRYELLDPKPLMSNKPVCLGGLTVINKVLNWFTLCENLNPYFQKCCLIISVALDFKLTFYQLTGYKAKEKSFHYTRNAVFNEVSKGPLFGEFLPTILGLTQNVFEIHGRNVNSPITQKTPKTLVFGFLTIILLSFLLIIYLKEK